MRSGEGDERSHLGVGNVSREEERLVRVRCARYFSIPPKIRGVMIVVRDRAVVV